MSVTNTVFRKVKQPLPTAWLQLGLTFVINICDVHMATGFLPPYWLMRLHRNHAQQNFGRIHERVCPGPGPGQVPVPPTLSSWFPGEVKVGRGPPLILEKQSWEVQGVGSQIFPEGCPSSHTCAFLLASFPELQFLIVCQGPALRWSLGWGLGIQQ